MTTLAVGLDAETLARINALLGENGSTVEYVSQARAGVKRASDTRFDLVTCSYPLPDMVLREFGRAVRNSKSASRDAALLVLSLPEMRTEALMGLPKGRALVRSRRDTHPLLTEAVRHLLRVAPRRSCHHPVTVTVGANGSTAALAATLVNLSTSGMLVSHSEPPEVDSSCTFELSLERGTTEVSGSGKVVRHAVARRERMHGFAVSFTALTTGCGDALESYLNAAV